MKTYQVGFTLRVSDGEEQTAHRMSIPVEALSSEHAANCLARALVELYKTFNTKPAEDGKSASKGAGKP